MKLVKQDVYIKSDIYDKYNECVLTLPDYSTSFAVCLKDVYVLTEMQLETLKQEYYGIGVKDGQNSK